MSSKQSFASTSLTRHLIRGVVGFGTLIGSVALIPIVGPVSLLLAPIGLVAFRGCPTCWAIGLAQTISMGRLQRICVDGRCELRVADHTPLHDADEASPTWNGPPSEFHYGHTWDIGKERVSAPRGARAP